MPSVHQRRRSLVRRGNVRRSSGVRPKTKPTRCSGRSQTTSTRNNEAVETFRQGNRAEAIRILRELVVGSGGDEEIKQAAKSLLDQLVDD